MSELDRYPTDYFGLNVGLVRIALLHYWTSHGYLIAAYKIICTSMVLLFLTPSEFATLAEMWNVSLNEFIDNLGISLSHVLGVIKAFTFLINQRTIREIMDELESERFHYEDGPGFQPGLVIQKFKNKSLKFTKLFSVSCTIVLYSAYLGALFNFIFRQHTYHSVDRAGNPTYCAKLPFYSWIPFDHSTAPTCLVAMFFQHLLIMYLTFMIIATDTLFMSCVNYITGHLVVLQGALLTIRERSKRKLVPGLALDTLMYDEMKKCVHHFETIYRLCRKMESVYTKQIFAQVFITTFITCTCLYLLSTEPLGRTFFMEVTYVLAIQMQLLLYCWFGNELTLSAIQIPNTVYHSDWLFTPVRFQKGLLFTMLRIKKPLVLTVGKFAPLSIQTWVMILRGSYSLFALLKKTGTKHE